MADRERKRAQRRKRKERSPQRPAGPGSDAAPTDEPQPPVAPDGAPQAEETDFRGRYRSRSEQRNAEARAALEPLEPGERPLVVTIAAIVCGVLAVSLVVGFIVDYAAGGENAPLAQIVVPLGLTCLLGGGMWLARYWAVLGFQAVLVLTLLSATIGLVQAPNVVSAIGTSILIAGAATFFWFMIKALARLQMPETHAQQLRRP
ncbi:MAG: hypothetical protein ACR2NA_04110 [Solirubrobacterales bacterium]